MAGEGLGFLSLSLDWTVVGAHGPLYTPLDAQVHEFRIQRYSRMPHSDYHFRYSGTYWSRT
jgi:hypothetical protein